MVGRGESCTLERLWRARSVRRVDAYSMEQRPRAMPDRARASGCGRRGAGLSEGGPSAFEPAGPDRASRGLRSPGPISGRGPRPSDVSVFRPGFGLQVWVLRADRGL